VLPRGVYVGKHLRSLQPDRHKSIAVVYEYGEDGENDTEAVENVTRFLRLAGFYFCPQPWAKNWRSGVLVDHSDIVRTRFYGWQKCLYGRRSS
jgi:hypothetical protein